MKLLVLIGVLALAGCNSMPTPSKPLNTGDETQPPPGCVELRKQGGKC